MPAKKITPNMLDRMLTIKRWKHRNMTYKDVADEIYKEYNIQLSDKHIQRVLKPYIDEIKDKESDEK